MPTKAITYASTVPSRVHSARIIDVNPETYTVSVATEYSSKPQFDISFSTPYQHFNNGEGIYFMPEVGSICWLCEPSDGSRPFVMSWSAPSNEKDFKANKKELNPGDIYLGTRDDNFLILRRGGIVQIGGGPLSQRMFIPAENVIRDFCENYELYSIAGSLEWSVDRTEEDTSGDRPCSLTIKVREKANDVNPIAFLKIGSHGNDNILTLDIKGSGDNGAESKAFLSIGKDGTVQWDIKQDWKSSIKGNATLEIEGNYSLNTKGNIELESAANFNIKGSQVNVESDSQTTVKGQSVVIDGSTQIGSSSAAHPSVKGDSLLAWLNSHQHICPCSGAPAVIQSPATPDLLSTKVFIE